MEQEDNRKSILTGEVTINKVAYTIWQEVEKTKDKLQTIYWGNKPTMTESAQKKYYPAQEEALQVAFSDAALFTRSKLFFLREELGQARAEQDRLEKLSSLWREREVLIQKALTQEDPAMCNTIDGWVNSRGEFLSHSNAKCSLPAHNQQMPHSFDKFQWEKK